MKTYIEFNLDKKRRFRMTMSAIKRIETKFKKAFAKIDHENLLVEDFMFVIWSCLEQSDRDEISPAQLLDLVDEYSSIQEVYILFKDIMESAFGKNEQRTAEEAELIEMPENLQEAENGNGEAQYKTLSDVV